ncbi:uroporphyrinogen decarboxylase [Melioribacter roseus P3M-2]|uniref:Uroporphyrinogen decarboxylase n=1 Tax=Melioribacter roseus (strain DSM 23840 / JCM 17771 / VKM B-2668 / P3M-2) TaxID=1191523 RepID=I6YXN0_MELRP|nr:uroporphyrinogen decarboxylase family protein [Melioribacter roseus]AFN75327.1 uroporphyrinogen decarboxylase [Melioribacter roseus P3M-2]
MTDNQWEILKKVIGGEKAEPLPVGFIIDSPWLPNWYGIKIVEYFASEELWFAANLKAINQFPEVMFLPGFWSEYGMCTEPSAFGARSSFPPNEFPHAHKLINSADEIESLHQPNPETDGLLPLMLNRLKLLQSRIEENGHKIRFAVARGPLNIASYLMGTTEFLTTMMMTPGKAHVLIRKITDFLKDWLDLQRKTFPSIDGIFLLDDIIGFMGEPEFKEFGLPYFKELFNTDVSVKFLHNDAPCKVSAPFLNEMGVNMFNMGIDVSLTELKELTENKITLVGNLPPRDVLAAASPGEVAEATKKMLDDLIDKSRLIVSCGGGMPPGVKTENIVAFVDTVKNYKI